MKTKVDKTNCCVFGCKTCRKNEPEATFHLFPRGGKTFLDSKARIELRKAWESALLMEQPSSNYMRICGKHFKKEDYVSSPGGSQKPRLKRNAIPSVNLPTLSQKIKGNRPGGGKLHARKRQMLNQESDVTNYASDLCEENVEENGPTLEDLCEGERNAVDSLLNLGSVFVNFQQNYHVEDENDQATGGDLVTSFTSKIENNKHLNSLTGLCSFKLLNYICSIVERQYLTVHTHKLSIQDRVVLVFFKLKTGIKFNVMARFFNISPSTCQETFKEYVQYIANVLKPCILWPSIEKSRANMPNAFKDYDSVRGIFDCIEIPVQEPRCESCQIKTYSHYRRRNTLKFMICISPRGLLTFISKGYGGRSSDKSIFEQSGVINKCEPYIDAIMVDKGFLVDDLCAKHNIKIVRPFLPIRNKQFPSVTVKKNVSLVTARAHVERTHQCIRTFEIFNSILPWNVVPYIDSIFTIACSIVNLQTKSRRDYILNCCN